MKSDNNYEFIDEAEFHKGQFIENLESTKFDLDDLFNRFSRVFESFYYRNKIDGLIEIDKISTYSVNSNNKSAFESNNDVSILISSMEPSFMAPAFHYNQYVDHFVNDLQWNPDQKYFYEEPNKIKYRIEIQALVVSVKVGLDRLVSVLHYYYKGFSPSTTWGRQKSNKNKYQGFMQVVYEQKEGDKLLSFIFNEYHDWIKKIVAPRDTIIHYNDLGIRYFFDTSNKLEIPIHFHNKLLKAMQDDAENKVYGFDFVGLKKYVDRWYEFVNYVFDNLINKSVLIKKEKIKF